jgi:DNA-binding transcriptional LysR family regulator
MPDLDLDDLAIFVKVVDRAGFAGAARDLRVPTSTVSRTITRLESAAGVRLVHRTTRTVRPTGEGRALYASVAPAVATLKSAVRSLEPVKGQPKGRLRVSVAHDLAATFLIQVMVDFMERHPLVEIDCGISERLSDLVDEGFDIAIRAAVVLRDSSLVVRKLGEAAHGLYASPRYLQKHGAPATVEELERHQCVVFRAKDLAKTWTLRDGDEEKTVDVRGRVGGDDFTFVRATVVAGGGIALLPRILCRKDEREGTLVRVLPRFGGRGATICIVYPSRHNVPARVTAFRDFVIEAFERAGGDWIAAPQ